MFDSFSWGGEVQALVYDPKSGKVTGVNALGAAPTGATPELFRSKGMPFPPQFGPLAAVTPGAPGGLIVMLAEFGQLSLGDVLAPAIDMAEGYRNAALSTLLTATPRSAPRPESESVCRFAI